MSVTLDLHPITPRYGAEVRNVDLATLDAGTKTALSAAVREHALLLVRRQSLTDEDLFNVSAAFGCVEIPAATKVLSSTHKEVVNISNLKAEDGTDMGGGGSAEMEWHADQAFRPHPATLSFLYCVHPALTGGQTWICNTRLGYESLPAELKARAEQVKGRYKRLNRNGNDSQEFPEVMHDAVLRHPGSDKKSLFLSANTKSLWGVDEEEGQMLLAKLLEYQFQEEHIYRHTWRPGDILIYDNGQTLHRRDNFTGLRWMKGTRAFLDPAEFAVPSGVLSAEVEAA